VHEVAQPPATVHVNPRQSWTAGAGQLPVPSQVAAGVKAPFAHDAGAQVVVPPYFSHAPCPSQCPVLPQLLGAAPTQRARGSSLPAATAAQVPSGALAVSAFRHDAHRSAQA